jgi:hypothetical protein
MKPPVDWSPCQQKGEEHEWTNVFNIAQQDYGETERVWLGLSVSYCMVCGVLVVNG